MKIFQLPDSSLKIDWSWISSLEKILRQKFKLKQAVSLALVSQVEMRKLNNHYRHKDKTTDVLAFKLTDQQSLPQQPLGEIVICWPQLKKQARENGNSLKDELRLLTVHGTLHLLGYEHQTKSQTAAMKKEETYLLNKI